MARRGDSEVSSFRSGSYQRHLAPKHVRHFCPTEALDKLEDVDLEGLRAAGKSVILLDVDNTLLPWRSRDIPESTTRWLEKAKAMGFQFCILSNTRNPERLTELAGKMGIPFVRDKFKPSTRMYNMALEQFKIEPSAAVMIGDQLLTDVLGANRAGIDSIWIKKIGDHEFIGTRLLSRNVERIVGAFLYKYFQAGDDNVVHEPEKPGFFEHNVVKQFIKFCVVGVTSTVIDVGLHFLLMFVVTTNGVPLSTSLGEFLVNQFPTLFQWAQKPPDAAFPILKIPTACLAILNAYYWNRRWTFGLAGSDNKTRQLRRYFLVALSGMCLNTLLTTVFNHVISGHPKRSWAIATAIATVMVAFWNFTGSRLYAFKDKAGPVEPTDGNSVVEEPSIES